MNQQLPQMLFMICSRHRQRYNIMQKPRADDCTTKACKTGCPIKRMPDIVPPEELEGIEAEVFREEIERKKGERLKNLKVGDQ